MLNNGFALGSSLDTKIVVPFRLLVNPKENFP